ncbi:hypothetical protein ABHO71_000024 [Stenotrophomonas maltophilia]|uniref:hypothetical protein n=1 Tax=Stenotrophomonas TaxID=40323 RepID=UPI001311ECDB|nr:hypothetical protein [Stenotrophomonas maltophilia]MBN5173000.1 hypothetical protein [Stenotrophomonas maltophilia]UBB22723.1 hypothetical protein LAD79_06460 [Stenotrophomonas maltophilia]HEL3778352.1 hypothetical protein [Stenotrophomonas maltophilia]HEL5006781.1 hypothetical protein [Stenotrophomonas maltophilia]
MKQQTFTFHITAAIDIVALLPMPGRSHKGAEREVRRKSAKKLAEALVTFFSINRIEKAISCSVDEGIAEVLPRVSFPCHRAGLMDFPETYPADTKEGFAELSGDGLATRSFAIQAATQEEALSRFRFFSAEQLNAVPWQVWGVAFYDAMEFTVQGQLFALNVSEEKIDKIADHIELEL